MNTDAPAPQTEIMTVDELANLLKVHPNTIYQRVEAGEIPGMFRLGNGERSPIRFSRKLIMEWIEAQATKP